MMFLSCWIMLSIFEHKVHSHMSVIIITTENFNLSLHEHKQFGSKHAHENDLFQCNMCI